MRLTRRPDVLVLGGGGVLGEAWLRSCLAGIEAESGWDLRECRAFVGTSAGSIVAAVLAAGRRPAAAGAASDAWERGAARNGSDPVAAGGLAAIGRRAGRFAGAAAAPLAPAVAAGLEPGGAAVRAALLRRGRRATREIPGLRGVLERIGGTFDGRLRVTAVDVRSGRRVIFGAPGAPEASVTDAVLASCAVPWMFRPVTIGGREYVDGGFWSAANLDAAPVERGERGALPDPDRLARAWPSTASARCARSPGASAAGESLVLRRRGARVRIAAPDAATVEAIGPNLFDARRRPPVEAAGYAQGRALASGRMNVPDHARENKAARRGRGRRLRRARAPQRRGPALSARISAPAGTSTARSRCHRPRKDHDAAPPRLRRRPRGRAGVRLRRARPRPGRASGARRPGRRAALRDPLARALPAAALGGRRAARRVPRPAERPALLPRRDHAQGLERGRLDPWRCAAHVLLPAPGRGGAPHRTSADCSPQLTASG